MKPWSWEHRVVVLCLELCLAARFSPAAWAATAGATAMPPAAVGSVHLLIFPAIWLLYIAYLLAGGVLALAAWLWYWSHGINPPK